MGMGEALSQQLSAKVQEVKDAVSGMTEDQAAKPKADGEWSAKQVLSHLCGDDDARSMYEFQRFLDEETPPLGIEWSRRSTLTTRRLRNSLPV
jgi:hypothetical protein